MARLTLIAAATMAVMAVAMVLVGCPFSALATACSAAGMAWLTDREEAEMAEME